MPYLPSRRSACPRNKPSNKTGFQLTRAKVRLPRSKKVLLTAGKATRMKDNPQRWFPQFAGYALDEDSKVVMAWERLSKCFIPNRRQLRYDSSEFLQR